MTEDKDELLCNKVLHAAIAGGPDVCGTQEGICENLRHQNKHLTTALLIRAIIVGDNVFNNFPVL